MAQEHSPNSLVRVGFVGAPGAGKTSTTRMLAAICRDNAVFKKVELVDEYAREFLAKYKTIATIFEQMWVTEQQIAKEEVVSADIDLLITDSPIHQAWSYVEDYNDGSEKALAIVPTIFDRLLKLNYPPRYDIIFHLPPVLSPVKDGVRPAHNFNQEWREELDEKIIRTFKLFPPKHFVTVEGRNAAERSHWCLEYLNKVLER